MKYMKRIIFTVIAILVLGGIVVFVKKRLTPPAPPQMPPASVQVAKPVIQDVVNYNEFTGNLVSVESVDIRARVEGLLRRVVFNDGAFVKKGELLFEIEPDTYQADRDRALATLKSAEADLNRAQQDYERLIQAVKSDAVSKQEVGTYKAQRDIAEASVIAAKAALTQAGLNLSYTQIQSPVDGKISRKYVDVGNLVGAGENTLLANVVALDPIYVYFNASESEYLNYTKDVRGNLADEPNKLPIYLNLANEEEYAHHGRLDYLDNMVDPETGTIQIRGVIPNPEKKLYPGMFVRIRVPAQTIRDAVLVQEKAIGTDIGGKYLLVVDADNIVRHQPVELGAQQGMLRVITSGLSTDDTYIVSGLQFVYPGSEVRPMAENVDSQDTQ